MVRIAGAPRELLTRPIYVICNNTLVENPRILEFVDRQLKAIPRQVLTKDCPLSWIKLHRSWRFILGQPDRKGISAQTACSAGAETKIRPTTLYIQNKISEHGEAIILIGLGQMKFHSRGVDQKARGERKSTPGHPLPGARLLL